jgi:hypothetical protein
MAQALPQTQLIGKNVLSTIYDTAIFAGVKMVLGKYTEIVHQPNTGDYVIYISSDLAFRFGMLDFLKEYKMGGGIPEEAFQAISQMLFSIGANWLFERKRIVDNLVAIGASSVVNNIVDRLIVL